MREWWCCRDFAELGEAGDAAGPQQETLAF